MSTPADTPTVIATVTRTTDPNGWNPTVYTATTTDGRTFTVRKEFYADGPSLFTWTINSPLDGYIGEANTKKAALTLITRLPAPSSAGSETDAR